MTHHGSGFVNRTYRFKNGVNDHESVCVCGGGGGGGGGGGSGGGGGGGVVMFEAVFSFVQE